MTIRPVEMNGMIQRTQDVSTLKQQEDVKPMVDQQNMQIQAQKDEMRKSEQVNKKNDTDKEEKKFDAKDKGSNEYQKRGGGKKKGQTAEADKVVLKGMSHGFDMKV